MYEYLTVPGREMALRRVAFPKTYKAFSCPSNPRTGDNGQALLERICRVESSREKPGSSQGLEMETLCSEKGLEQVVSQK